MSVKEATVSVTDIEAAITKLPAKDVAELTAWLVEYHHHLWDEQIARDAKAGKLAHLAEQAKAEYRAGRTKPL